MIHRRQAKLLRGKRIAFLSASIHSGSSLKLWHPLADEAERSGVELFLFPGGRLAAADGEEALKNRLFDFVADAVDGVVTWASALGGYVGAQELDTFHDRFASLPMVGMAHRLPGRPTVRIDAYAGMFPLLDHLYEVHGARRLAFISGPEEHESAQDRSRAFMDFHRRRGIAADGMLMSSPRPWNEGAAAIKELLDDRRLIPGRDFDALLAASDLQLYEAVQVLQSRGCLIPQDLRVAGFNDSVESRIASPSFTTVHLPFDDQARLAFKDLLSLLAGEEVPPELDLECRLVLRRSCGCLSPSVIAAGGTDRSGPFPPEGTDSDGLLRAALVSAAAEAGLSSSEEERTAWIEPLADAYLSALSGEGIPFLELLERILERQIRLGRDISAWQDVLSALKRTGSFCLSGPRAAAADRTLDRARVAVAEASLRMHRLELWETERRGQVIRELEKELINLQERDELSRILAARLTFLGIGSAYVVELGADGAASCVAGYREDGRLIPRGAHPCSPGCLLPRDLTTPHPGATWVVEPLCGNGRFFGWMLMLLGVRDGGVYEELRGAVSSALLGLRSIDLIRKARADAERAERLKSAFLANVSAEYLEPLRDIEREAGRLGPKGASIRLRAREQLQLTRNILELSRAEAGDLALKPVLLDPRAVLALAEELSAEEEGEGPTVLSLPSRPMPLVAADGRRLSGAIAGLIAGAGGAEIGWELQGGFLVLDFVLTQVPAKGERLYQESSRALARRILAAHGGLLEEGTTEDGFRRLFLRLPLPTLGGGAPDASGTAQFWIGPGRDGVPGVDPAALLAEAKSYGSTGLFLWDFSSLDLRDLSLLLNCAKEPALSRIPCAVFGAPPEPAVAEDLSGLIKALVSSAVRKSLVVIDADGERRRALVACLGALPAADLRVLDDAEGCREAMEAAGSGLVLVMRGPDVALHSRLRELHVAGERPLVIMLCDRLSQEEDLEGILGEPGLLLLNDGVLEPEEFAALTAELLQGRELLPPYTGAIVKRAILYLNQHLSRPVLRWKMAEDAAVSEDYLTRVFGKELGISPWEYLIRLRIREAKRLLAESSIGIGAVAEAVGFSDQAYFCRVFKKMTGKPPRAFRKGEGPLSSSE